MNVNAEPRDGEWVAFRLPVYRKEDIGSVGPVLAYEMVDRAYLRGPFPTRDEAEMEAKAMAAIAFGPAFIAQISRSYTIAVIDARTGDKL